VPFIPLTDAFFLCFATFVIGVAILWKDPPPPSDDDNADILRRMDGDRNWDDITGGWT